MTEEGPALQLTEIQDTGTAVEYFLFRLAGNVYPNQMYKKMEKYKTTAV